QEIELIVATNEIDQTRRVDRLETALGSQHALNRPRRNGLANTLHLVQAQLAQTEQIAEQPARGGSDDNRSRLGHSLKASRKVRRVSDPSALPSCTLAAEVADHHQAGRDANADRERLRGRGLELRNRCNDIESRPHGSLGIVFVGAGMAEICQYPIAPEIAEKAVTGL